MVHSLETVKNKNKFYSLMRKLNQCGHMFLQKKKDLKTNFITQKMHARLSNKYVILHLFLCLNGVNISSNGLNMVIVNVFQTCPKVNLKTTLSKLIKLPIQDT